MRKSDVIAYFKTPTKAAKAIGVTKSAVSQWGKIVPERIAYRVQEITGDALRVDPSKYKPMGKVLSAERAA